MPFNTSSCASYFARKLVTVCLKRLIRSRWLSVLLGLVAFGLLVGDAVPRSQQQEATPTAGQHLWVGESAGILKCSPDGTVQQEFTDAPNALAVATDQLRGVLWAYTAGYLRCYDLYGNFLLNAPTPPPGGRDPARVALSVNQADGSAWLGLGTALYHIGPQGESLANTSLPSSILQLAAEGARAVVWIGTSSELAAYDAASLTKLYALNLGSRATLSDFFVNEAGNQVWAALSRDTRRYNLAGTLQLTASLGGLGLICADGAGGLWGVAGTKVYRLNVGGTQILQVQLQKGEGNDTALIGDPLDQSCWAAEQHAVTHFGGSGQLLYHHNFSLEQKTIFSLSLFSDDIPPAIGVLSPVDGAWINTNRPTLAVIYSDIDSGVDPSTLSFRANGAPITMSCTASQSGATCSPSDALPEGQVVILATVQDFAGNLSAPAQVVFNVDTVPPGPVDTTKIVVQQVGPAQAIVVASQGAAEAAATIRITNVASRKISTTAAQDDGSFTAGLLAQSGDGLLFVALDRAGNQSAPALVTTPGNTTLPPDPSQVAPAQDPTVAFDFGAATAFLYSGSPPIQTGVVSGAIRPAQVAVLRGKVLGRDGQPLPGVTVRLLSNPEIGRTLTRTDGVFDLAVNGGGNLSVVYEKPGYLSAQRNAVVPWHDFTLLPDVALTALDAQVSVVDMGASSFQIAQGSTASDADGQRRATILFPPNTQGVLNLADGSTYPIASLHVRATEFTTGLDGQKAMPAPLPPNSAYTYCVELSADEAQAMGADGVTFNHPVYQYIENYLGFPVGASVPSGYYDRPKGAWASSDNGRVMKVLSVTGGMADLDVTDSGSPSSSSDLASLGITDGERAQLATHYSPGQSLWRIPIPHFSAWDFNCGYGPPNDAIPPDGSPPEDTDMDDPCKAGGSVIGVQNQSLGEVLPVVGIPFALHYQSNRTPGYKTLTTLTGRASGASVPASLRRIEISVAVAGVRVAQQTLPAAPNQRYTVAWDGLDAWGQAVSGSASAELAITYVYPATYLQTAQMQRAFGSYSDTGLSAGVNRAALEVNVSQHFRKRLTHWDVHETAINGWSLSAHHRYDPQGQVIYLGTGESRSVSNIGSTMSTAVTSNTLQSYVSTPCWVATGPDGTLYITGPNTSNLVEIAPGRLTNVPGVGGGNVVAAGDGAVYVYSAYSGGVTKIAPDGTLSTVSAAAGDALTLDSQGSLYVRFASNQIGRVGADGMVMPLAGNGTQGYDGDGGPALLAMLNQPSGLAVGPDGSLYIADSGNNRVRKVGVDGKIRTIAGTGAAGYNGDGILATSAFLKLPLAVAVDRSNNVYISDTGNARVRMINPAGIITTVAGTGNEALLTPYGLGLSPAGDVFVCNLWDVQRVGVSAVQANSTGYLFPSEEGAEVYQFDAKGRHLQTVDALTGTLRYQFVYTADGYLSALVDAAGNTTTIERAGSVATAIIAPDGARTALGVDGGGYLSSSAAPQGDVTQFIYNSEGLMASLTDPKGQIHSFEYDTMTGRLVKDSDPAGGFSALSETGVPSGLGWATTLSTAEGRSTVYTIEMTANGDEMRKVAQTGCACNAAQTLRQRNGTTITTYQDGTLVTATAGSDPRWGLLASFPASGLVKTPSNLTLSFTTARSASTRSSDNPLDLQSLTDTAIINGHTYTSLYNATTRTVTTTTPTGRQAVTTLDALGRVTQESRGGLTPVTFAYDARGRLSDLSQGARSALIAYNAQGFLQSITDSMIRTVQFAYDADGRVTSQMLPDGRVVGFTYDANGNVTSVTPPSNPAHAFTYTPVDLQGAYAPPDVGIGTTVTTYAYNKDRQVTSITRPDGLQIGLGYDALGRPGTIATPTGTTTLTYDSQKGQLASIQAPGGVTTSYTYDGFLPTGETWAGPVAGSVQRTFTNDFRLSTVNANGQNPVVYTYDNDGLITGAGGLSLTRDPQNGLLTGSTAGSVTDSRIYSGFGEISDYIAEYPAGLSYVVHYDRDGVGRITTKVETINGTAATYGYSYDQTGRLTDVTLDGGPCSHYGYDSNGNRTSYTGAGGAASGTYDAQDRMLAYGNYTYTYTANGELASRTDVSSGQVTQYIYDVLGNLRTVALPDGTTIEYVIDGRSRRIGRKVNGALVQGWLYDGQLQPIAEVDANGTIVSRFIYATHTNVPDYMTKRGVTYRIITDHLGSLRFVIDTATGAIAQRIDYDEFGSVLLDTNPGFQPFGFAGGVYDSQTRLVRFGARDYDAQSGRWTSKDPLFFAGNQPNFFAYVSSDPINFIDPSGLDAVTADPGLLICFYLMFKEQGFGSRRTESAAIIRFKNGKYCLEGADASGRNGQIDQKVGDLGNVVGEVHTHSDQTAPTASGSDEFLFSPAGGKAIYTIHSKGIWRWTKLDGNQPQVGDEVWADGTTHQWWEKFFQMEKEGKKLGCQAKCD